MIENRCFCLRFVQNYELRECFRNGLNLIVGFHILQSFKFLEALQIKVSIFDTFFEISSLGSVSEMDGI